MIRRILMAYDGSENGRRALEVAAELSAKLDAGLMIAHVLMHGRPPEELVRMAEAEHIMVRMQERTPPGMTYAGGHTYDLVAATKDLGEGHPVLASVGDQLITYAKTRSEELGAKDIQTTVRIGDFADQILEAANAYQADMIVMGSRGLGTIGAAVLGSVSQKVLHHAPQTVVAVK